MKKIYFIFITLFLFFLNEKSYGQIAAWNFTGANQVDTWVATTFNTNLVSASGANNVTRGLGAAASPGTDSFRTAGFQNNGISVANTDYFQITLTAQTGNSLSLSTIDASFAGTGTFSASPGVQAQFAYSLDGTTFTLIGSPFFRIGNGTMTQINLSSITALQNLIAGTTATIRYYASGRTATGGWGFTGANGLAIGGTLTPAVSNTISAPSAISNITLANCTATQDIIVTGATSTGTFTGGNQYTAQLSDASGSFTSPLATASVSSTSNTIPNITLTIPAGTPTGAGYLVRIISNNPSVTGTSSNAFTITQSGSCVSNASDYFRSRQTGNWNVAGNWESSANNTDWITATLVPNNNANTILIRNAHNITISTNVTLDQLIVQSGGTLTHSGGTLTINDDTNDDISIEGGGVFISQSALAGFIGSANIRVKTNGMIRSTSGNDGARYAASGLTSPASVANNVIWENTSIYEYAQTNIFGSDNVIYFPNVTSEIPIFRITGNVGVVGAGTLITFNGVFEANGNITFQNAGIKTFRNGIRGTGTITQNANSGKFSITGTTAELSGVTLNMFSTAGFEFENNGVITINNDLTLSSGTLKFISSDLNLNGKNLTLNGGTIQEDLTNNHTIIDNTATTEASKGGAIIYTANVTSATTNFFGAGLTLNHGGTGNYTISVKRRHYSGGFGKGIKRIYQITGTPTGTSVMTIRYAQTELGTVSEPLSISRWQLATGWESYTPDVADDVNNMVTYNNVTAFSDWTLSGQNNALPIQLIFFGGKLLEKNTSKITWKTATETNHQYFILEKSENESDKNITNNFIKISQIDAQGNSTQTKEYNFVDNNFLQSAYYRLIQVDNNGTSKEVGLFFLKNENAISLEIFPNPILENVTLKGEKNAIYTLNIQNLEGKNIFSTKGNLEFLENKTQNQLKNLQSGNYLFVFQNENQRIIKRIVKN